MKPIIGFSKQSTGQFDEFEINLFQDNIGSAVQKTGFAQSIDEETQSRYDLIKRIDTLENNFKELFTFNTVTINSLNHLKWNLIKPVNVAIEQRSPEDFIACLYDIDLYGYGDSIPEALEDFKTIMVNQFEFLKEQEERQIELGELPKNQLIFLSSIIAEINA